MERQLLGSIILDPPKLQEVSGIIGRDSFYEERHRRLFEHLENMPTELARDNSLLTRWLASVADLEACGGVAYLAEIAGSVPYAANAVYYARIVADLAVKRRIRERAEGILQLAQNPSVSADDLRMEVAAMVRATPAAEAVLPPFAKLISSAELVELDTRPEFLVNKIRLRGQSGAYGARSKEMKTSVMIDEAISLGSGTPFLGMFDSVRVNVAVWSGESGAATIRAKALAIADSKGVDLSKCSILWNFSLPTLCQAEHLEIMRGIIEKNKIAVSFIDPLYLSLLDAQTAGQAGNLYAMGNALLGLSQLSQELETAFVLLHHFIKAPQADNAEPCSIEQLSQSGIGEWARCLLLLQRQTPFTGDGRHDLLMRIVNSVGFGGLYHVEIDEGILDDNFSGRKWEVNVTPAGDFREQAKRIEQIRREEQRKVREAETLDADRKEIVGAMVKVKEAESKNGIRERVSCGHARFAKAFASLIADGTVLEATVTKANGQKYPGWRLRNEEN
jgi:replicative DNA helicase